MAKKSCKKGYYYCNTDKKCKKIPKGWHVMPATGYLMRDSEHKDENKDETEGKKKNGNGNGSNGNGNGNGGSNGGSNGGGVSESKDHEVAMAQSQLKKSARNIAKLRKALGKKEKDIPAWMQAKITDTAHDTDAAAGYADKMDEEVIAEKRDGKSAKSKGYSLRDWFKGGGWVQAGGKYDGKPCAKQPGQKTKPFCRDADDRANMSKKERNRRAAKKRREDPNPNRKGKAKMVSASYSNWRADLEQLDEGAAQAIRLGLAAGTAIGGAILGKKAHDAIKGMTDRRNKRLDDALKKARGIGEGYDEIRPYDRIKMGDGKLRTIKDIDARLKDKKKPVQKNSFEPEGDLIDEGDMPTVKAPKKTVPMPTVKGSDKASKMPNHSVKIDEGKKDACYHKVKSRYSVWPSAYASGALVKCRKVGAKNWGNKTKKEEYIPEFASKATIERMKREGENAPSFSTGGMTAPNNGGLKGGNQHLRKGRKKIQDNYDLSNWRDDFQATEYESIDIIKAEPLQPSQPVIDEAGKKCWKGYKKAGTQKLFGKTYNRCVKAHFSDWRADMELQEAIPGYDKYNDAVAAAKKLTGRKKIDALKAAAKLRPATEKEVNQKLGEDWQKKSGKNPEGGLNEKGRKSYERENPGSDLKRPSKKVGNPRRKSFCARMKGMKKKLTSSKTANDPDSRINKSLRAWNC